MGRNRKVTLNILWVAMVMIGCDDVNNSSHLPINEAKPSTTAPAAIFRDGDIVRVLDDRPENAFVRVESLKYGDTFFVHRDYVRPGEKGHLVVDAATVYNKPEHDEDQYFTLREINQMRAKIPALFRTHPSGHDVIASWKAVAPFFHRGELAWPVYECMNPECPELDAVASGEHVLFILPSEEFTTNDLARLRSNPQLVYRNQTKGSPQFQNLTFAEVHPCPYCQNLPDYATNREKYKGFVNRYQLPEATSMWERLQYEYQRGRKVRARRQKGNLSVSELFQMRSISTPFHT